MPSVKNFLISHFIRLYDVATDEIKLNAPEEFASFNDFFVRELAPGARPVDTATNSLSSPVDGTLSSAGQVHIDSIFQAKGLHYTLDDLLATDLEAAHEYIDGSYATIYLAPYNYHRVHAPMSGEIVAARYVPGDLFSVNTKTVTGLPRLFCRNERLVLHFSTRTGPAAIILVGALNVGSISTPWSGEIRPRKTGVVEVLKLPTGPVNITKGDLLGWFNMGSTVIALLPKGVCEWHRHVQPGMQVKMGQSIGTLNNSFI